MGKKHQDLLVNAQQIVNPFYVEFLGGCGQALEFTLKPSLIFSGLCSNGSESYGWSIDEDCRWWGGRHCHHCCPTLRVIPNRPTWWWCHPRPQTCIEFVTCATKWSHIWCPNVRTILNVCTIFTNVIWCSCFTDLPGKICFRQYSYCCRWKWFTLKMWEVKLKT